MIEYDKLKKALTLLQEQNNRFRSFGNDQEDWIVVAVKESIVQRFETCWDCLWKVLKRYLSEEIGLAEVPNGPNPILRLANENSLLKGPVDDWISYGKARISTSHGYSGEKADKALDIMDNFVRDAVALYETLSGEEWNSDEEGLRSLDLTVGQLQIISDLLKQYLPGTEVWAYGSRVNHTSRPASDLDLVAFVSSNERDAVFSLREAFDESDLPFRVDLFIWDEVPENFHKNIEAGHYVLQA